MTALNKYAYIDALRGWAILGVILFHSFDLVLPNSHPVRFLTDNMALSVQLFFVVSALTLCSSLTSRKTQEQSPTRNFYIRRFFRIAPLFYGAIIAYALINRMQPSFDAPHGVAWWTVLLTLFFVNGWMPNTINAIVPGGWSVAVEVSFYLILPLLVATIKSFRMALVFLAAMIVIDWFLTSTMVDILRPLFGIDLATRFAGLWFFAQTTAFGVGIMVFRWLTSRPAFNRQQALLVLGGALILIAASLRWRMPGEMLDKRHLFAIAFGLLSVSLHHYPNLLFVNRSTIAIGKLSFGLYLSHIAIIEFLIHAKCIPSAHSFVLQALLTFGLVSGISMIVSIVTYTLIEKPGIAAGKRIIDALEAGAAR